MKCNLQRIIFSAMFLLLLIFSASAEYRVLHHFTGSPNDGTGPLGNLIQSGSMFFGMTDNSGGSNNLGTVFKIDSDGTGFQLLHKFVGGIGDGAYPSPGPLLLSVSTLYGMTGGGGSSDNGVIFALDLEFSDCNEVKAAGFRLEADIYGDGDCYVDLYDFSVFAQQWLYCNNHQDPNRNL